jgi:hypothetical protein
MFLDSSSGLAFSADTLADISLLIFTGSNRIPSSTLLLLVYQREAGLLQGFALPPLLGPRRLHSGEAIISRCTAGDRRSLWI